MPELPEVETVRRGLAPHIEGAEIADVRLNRPDLRFPFPTNFAARLKGQRILHVGRRAKYLLFALSGGETLLSHLGMTGNFRFTEELLNQPTRYYAPDAAAKHDHVVLSLKAKSGAKLCLIYSDPRRFGFMDVYKDQADTKFLAHLGPEPLGNLMSATHLAGRFAGRRTPIKSALLDQANIAGLGNIYVSEALWRSKIHPATKVGGLVTAAGAPKPSLDALTIAIKTVLDAAIKAGGSTLKDFRSADGETGYFQHNFDVYDREHAPCRRPGCGGMIMRIVQSGRASYLCPACQPEIS